MVNPADEWALYSGHRLRFTEGLLNSAGKKGGRLCLLGAGNCNDVDLERLAETFSEIHLVDIDPKALSGAVARQTPAVQSRLHAHAPIDLSGLSQSKWKKRSPTFAQVEAAARLALQSIVARLPGPFDVVASACVLTQMSYSLRELLGDQHPMLGPIRHALMVTHLSTLVGLTAAGGSSLFVCDLVSSTSYPLLDLPADRDLHEVMSHIVETGSFYFAANPVLVLKLLGEDEVVRDRVGEPDLLDPWLWTGPLGRTYLVYAIRFLRL